MAGYLVPVKHTVNEIIIKNSRFIASAQAADSMQAHQQHLLQCQHAWPDASHYCTAAIVAAPGNSQAYAMSDDGEPSGTAGKPMFHVLQSSGLGEVSVVVTRYFGGVKLGTGGLQRAYSQAVAEVLKLLPTQEKILRKLAYINYDYADQNAIEHFIKRYDSEILEQEFTEQVSMRLAVVAESALSLQNDIKNATQGRVALTIINGEN
ncbi:YigZ family protein [Pseudidiomarina woesei]|uniref:Uncharacterized protein, YigZ family n=1 Tax=Pseudidiomarina woesei TaxID=1381080 RepID=A0A0K6H960_9GAMM|nr:YigZ family protein [Pseudidiomarina woesei]CUA87513.1 uncharacterized protein, YigZ family [Pseudidiomarina woesei]